MNAANEELLKKIAQLKAKAVSCEKMGEVAEAQTFAAKVQQLLLEHNLSMTDVDMIDLAEEKIRIGQFNVDPDDKLWRRSSRIPWMLTLARVVANSNFCDLLSGEGSEAYFVGTESNIQVAGYMWIFLCRTLYENCERDYVEEFYRCKRQGDATAARGFMGTYRIGFIQEIDRKLSLQKKRQEGAASKNALVFVGKMMERVEAVKNSAAGGDVKINNSPRGGMNLAGAIAGKKLAERTQLNSAVGSAENKSRLLK